MEVDCKDMSQVIYTVNKLCQNPVCCLLLVRLKGLLFLFSQSCTYNHVVDSQDFPSSITLQTCTIHACTCTLQHVGRRHSLQTSLKGNNFASFSNFVYRELLHIILPLFWSQLRIAVFTQHVLVQCSTYIYMYNKHTQQIVCCSPLPK